MEELFYNTNTLLTDFTCYISFWLKVIFSVRVNSCILYVSLSSISLLSFFSLHVQRMKNWVLLLEILQLFSFSNLMHISRSSNKSHDIVLIHLQVRKKGALQINIWPHNLVVLLLIFFLPWCFSESTHVEALGTFFLKINFTKVGLFNAV